MMIGGFELPKSKPCPAANASAVDLMIRTIAFREEFGRVTSISKVGGMEGDTIILQDIFVFRQTGLHPNGQAMGLFEATRDHPGFVPGSKQRASICRRICSENGS